jgi:hypothetical protein
VLSGVDPVTPEKVQAPVASRSVAAMQINLEMLIPSTQTDLLKELIGHWYVV